MRRIIAPIGCWSLVAFLVSGTPALAQNDENSSDEETDVTAGATKGTGISLLFGLEAGGAWSVADDGKKESDKKGSHFAGKAIFSLFSDQSVLDVGAGWFDNRIYGTAVDSESVANPDQSRIKTQAGYLEFAGRYRLGEHFELGPVAQMAFGIDSTFSPFPDEPDTPNVYAGMQFVYAYRNQKTMDSRISLSYLTDVTIKARQMHFLTLGFAIGLPLVRPDVVVKRELEVIEQDKYVLDAEFVNFETDKADLLPYSKKFLQVLGRYLARHPEIYERLVIAGHADTRGSAEYNMDLSRRRAQAVADELKGQGVPEDRLDVRYYGFADPADPRSSARSLARNRRVEVYFVGETNVEVVRTVLTKLRQLIANPPTCNGDDCL